ncbi:MGMT family protein [Dysgonomonas sp. 520]|uniref:MGMT family protein n=1 Tax=Dysgonomonas sp. 520 TaxID=2302931 RepID=UPI0013D14816|nr:MGMT family protein [Dysgonomonas sp. 520]NDW08788.1 cysteine methyltransferase [Dysgonomonas sp. 520]
MKKDKVVDKDAFRCAIYDIVKTIPEGRASSYGAIARAIGYPHLSRMVGRVMGECDSTKTGIPAHRVVNSQGALSAKAAFGNAGEMPELLEAEGVAVVNDRIKNWKTIFWNPLDEMAKEIE